MIPTNRLQRHDPCATSTGLDATMSIHQIAHLFSKIDAHARPREIWNRTTLPVECVKASILLSIWMRHGQSPIELFESENDQSERKSKKDNEESPKDADNESEETEDDDDEDEDGGGMKIPLIGRIFNNL